MYSPMAARKPMESPLRSYHSASSLNTPPSIAVTVRRQVRHGRNPSIQRITGCVHFHYENVELGPIQVRLDALCKDEIVHPSQRPDSPCYVFVVSNSTGVEWKVERSYAQLAEFDRQLHRCVYDRRYSRLSEFVTTGQEKLKRQSLEEIVFGVETYFRRFSEVAGSLITCYPVLKWLELDNRGNRLLPAEETAINTPGVASAYVVRDYVANESDELTLRVGDIISVIDMPSTCESIWWRGKLTISSSEYRIPWQMRKASQDPCSSKQLCQVGFFPSHCVQLFGSKAQARLPKALETPRPETELSVKKGKLMTFMRSFLHNRPSRKRLKETGILKERVFGCDLAEHLENAGYDVPLVLKSCSAFVEQKGIVNGIYRLSGVVSNIQRLRNSFDSDEEPNLDEESILRDIHSVGSLLKMYFRELPNPLFTYQLYNQFVDAVKESEDRGDVVRRLQEVVQQLPPPHYRTAEFLMRHLSRLSQFKQETSMSSENLAIVWAPNLFRSHEQESLLDPQSVALLNGINTQAVLTDYMIRFVDIIFSHKMSSTRTHSERLASSSASRAYKARRSSARTSSATKLMELSDARRKLQAVRDSKIPADAGLPNLLDRKCIDVGPGPQAVGDIHTVIQLPSKQKPSALRNLFGNSSVRRAPPSISGPMPLTEPALYGSTAHSKGWDVRRVTRRRQPGLAKKPRPQTTVEDQQKNNIAMTPSMRTVRSAESLISMVTKNVNWRNSWFGTFGKRIEPTRPGLLNRSFETAAPLMTTSLLDQSSMSMDTTSGSRTPTLSHDKSCSSQSSTLSESEDSRFVYETSFTSATEPVTVRQKEARTSSPLNKLARVSDLDLRTHQLDMKRLLGRSLTTPEITLAQPEESGSDSEDTLPETPTKRFATAFRHAVGEDGEGSDKEEANKRMSLPLEQPPADRVHRRLKSEPASGELDASLLEDIRGLFPELNSRAQSPVHNRDLDAKTQTATQSVAGAKSKPKGTVSFGTASYVLQSLENLNYDRPGSPDSVDSLHLDISKYDNVSESSAPSSKEPSPQPTIVPVEYEDPPMLASSHSDSLMVASSTRSLVERPRLVQSQSIDREATPPSFYDLPMGSLRRTKSSRDDRMPKSELDSSPLFRKQKEAVFNFKQVVGRGQYSSQIDLDSQRRLKPPRSTSVQVYYL